MPHNRHFEAAARRGGWALAVAASLAAAGAAPGCARRADTLTKEDQRLVLELVARARATLAAAGEDPARTAAAPGGTSGDSTAVTPAPGSGLAAGLLPAWLDSAGLEQRLEGPWARLWADPERGRRVLQAVHDSLGALRSVLFPPPPRPAARVAPDSTARPRVP